MNCPVCGSEAVKQDDNNWCPKCRIFLGKNLNIKPKEEPDSGGIYRSRARKKFLLGLLTTFIIILIILPGVAYFVVNFTSFGYREKIFYRYRFTGQASSYLRKETSITVLNISETKPFGFTHSGRWKPSSKNVKLNTANDEVAIHELAHAWWEEQRKDKKVREGLINDTIKLSKMTDETYLNAIKMAKWIVANHAGDDHHFYAYMAEFTMGKFKDGPNKLPEFMWPYFETIFSGSPRVVLCYETNSCYFSFMYKDL